MPESRDPDPLRSLSQFGHGGLDVNPLDPTEVRRRGDRRRNTRRGAIAVATAAVVVAAVTPFALNAGGGKPEDAPSFLATTTPTPTPAPTPSPTSDPTSEAPDATVIDYPGIGVSISDPADVGKLGGTSPEFKSFVADTVRDLIADNPGCTGSAIGVTVQKYSSAGYAIGGVNACGGYEALWVRLDDVWQQGLGSQDVWDCDALTYLGVPQSFAGQCANESGIFGPTEVDGLKLGMTPAQLTDAGATVLGKNVSTCRGLLRPYHPQIPDRTQGYVSPTQGLVAVFADANDKTPERIGLGTRLAAVKLAYPSGQLNTQGYWVVPLGNGHEYQFGIGEDDRVQEMLLASSEQDCFG